MSAAAFGNILTDSPAQWASDDVTLDNKVDNALQNPPPVSADARERVIAKQLNTYCKALNDIVDFLQGRRTGGRRRYRRRTARRFVGQRVADSKRNR